MVQVILINFLAKITSVCDVFDAVVSRRAYHKARTTYSGASILVRDAIDSKLDMDIVNVFISQIYLFKRGDIVQLSNGVSGCVLNDCKDVKPFIKTTSGSVIDLSKTRGVKIIKA